MGPGQLVPDNRVQAIRCASCHRLRPYPTKSDPACACGSLQFFSSGVLPDEEKIAIKLYERELTESGAFNNLR